MVTAESPVKLTYEDYKNTPEDERYELLDGVLVRLETPPIIHQRVDMDLGTLMNLFVKENDLGRVFPAPTDVLLSDTIVVQPDLLFISNERAHIITEQNIQGAPDLVVEILSPSTANRDWTTKRDLLCQAWRERAMDGGPGCQDRLGNAAPRWRIRAGGSAWRRTDCNLDHA